MPEKDLVGEVAFITGGGRGIGQATARLIASRGAKVAVGARSIEEVQSVASELVAAGAEALAVTLDVSDEESVRAAIGRTREEFGDITLLVNNAGTGGPFKSFAEITTEQWDETFNINMRGSFLCAKYIFPKMIEARRGVIVNVASIWTTKAGPNRAPYIASKHAVVGFTKALSEEAKPYGVRVCAVNPGPTITQMTIQMAPEADHPGWMVPEQVAEVIVYLCSPAAGVLTGSVVDAFGFGRPIGT